MSLFFVDQEKCERCGICAAVCPVGIIRWLNSDTLPEPVDRAAELCLVCGHCLAVCPHGALSLTRMPVEDCPKIDRQLLPTFDQFREMVRARRSIRVYKDTPVDREVITELIDLARYAPTGKNVQLLGWQVYRDPKTLVTLVGLVIDWMRDMVANGQPMAAAFGMKSVIKAWEDGVDPILRSAPVLVVLHAPKNYAGGLMDSTIALTTLELAAFSHKLGACWAGFFQIAAAMWPSLRQALELPPDQVSTAAMMLGYAKFRFQRQVQRNQARITWR